MGRIDLDAVQAEAHGEPHVIEFSDDEFTIPPIKDWPAEALELVARGWLTEAFRMAMGDDQYERFASHKPKMQVYEALLDTITEDEGLGDTGNWSRSSRSSRSTRQRSKPTSPATTASA